MTDEMLFLYLNGELNKKEAIEIENWISKHPEDFNKVKIIWEGTQFKLTDNKPDLSKAWAKINPEKMIKGENPINTHINMYKRYFQYAAVIILCLSIGVLGYYWFTGSKNTEWAEYKSLPDETSSIELPDGSHVTLNKNSQILYKKENNADTRELKLYGEAFFQVQKNPKKPFMVYTANTITKVLGTSFNINAKDTTNFIEIDVETGQVAFYQTKTNSVQTTLLTKGERAVFSAKEKTIIKYHKTDDNYLAWKTNTLIFNNKSLSEVVEILSRHFETNITISTVSMEKQVLTARFQNKTLNEILNTFDIALDIRHKQTSGGILLYNK